MNESAGVSAIDQHGRIVDVLRNRAFMRLWVVQAFSQTAQNMTNFSLLILVRAIIDRYQIEQANTAIALTVLSFSVPGILISPFAGVVVDRSNKRTVLVASNALRALAVVGFLLMRSGWRPLLALAVLYAITFCSGAVGQFFGPALGSTIPLLVPPQDNINANALFNLTFTASQIAGFAALGPILIKLFGVHDVLLGIIAMFLVSTLLSMTIPSTPPVPSGVAQESSGAQRVMNEVQEGVLYILRSKVLMKAITYLSMATASYLMIAVLGPGFVTSVLRLERQDIAYLVAPAGVGIVIGALFVGRFTARLGSEGTIDYGLTSGGLVLIGLALAPALASRTWEHSGQVATVTVVVAAILAALLGLANSLVLVPSQSLLQSASPEHIRARVYATFFTISNSVAFLPIVFAGALADLFGVVKVLVALGLILLVIGAVQIGIRHR